MGIGKQMSYLFGLGKLEVNFANIGYAPRCVGSAIASGLEPIKGEE